MREKKGKFIFFLVLGVVAVGMAGCQPLTLNDLRNLALLFGFDLPGPEDIPEIPNLVKISEDFGDGDILDSDPLYWDTTGVFKVKEEDDTPFPVSSGRGLRIEGDDAAPSSTSPVSVGMVKKNQDAPNLQIDDFLFLLATVDFLFVGNPNPPFNEDVAEGAYRFAIGFDLSKVTGDDDAQTFSGLAVVVDGVENTFRIGRTEDIRRVFESDGLEVLDEADAGGFEEIETIIEEPEVSEERRALGLPAHLYRIEANKNPMLVQFFYDEVSIFRLEGTPLTDSDLQGGTMAFIAGPQSTVFLDDVNFGGADFFKPRIPGINA